MFILSSLADLITTQELHTDKAEGRGRAGGGGTERRELGGGPLYA